MRAIILAAGKGTRLKPMTLTKPKPLLEIRGVSLLENMIMHLRQSGVKDIVLVSGYKHELFAPIAKAQGLTQLVFPDYELCNSSKSLLFAKDYICKGSIILNGDLYITQGFCHLFKKNACQFLAQKIPPNTTAWGYITDENYKILDIDTNAKEGYGDGIAYFDNERDIGIFTHALQQCHKDDYWEQAVLDTLGVINYYAFCHDDLYTEIDSFSDALYHALLTPEEIACQCADDGRATRLAGITNTNYLIHFQNTAQVIRIPGLHTEQVINRDKEAQILDLIAPLHITPESRFYGSGIKMSDYLSDHKPLDFAQISDEILEQIASKLLALHSIKHTAYPHFEPILLCDEIAKYQALAHIKLTTPQEHKRLMTIAKTLDKRELVLCHRDLQLPNILYNASNGELLLIDFEYAGFSCIEWELGNLAAELELSQSQILALLHHYNASAKRIITYTDVLYGKLMANYIWALWGWVYHRIDLGRMYLARFSHNLAELESLESTFEKTP